MIPPKEMLEAYFDELSHFDKENERVWFFAGIAAYCHLQSPGSDEWKQRHGLPTSEEEGGQDETD